MRLPFSELMRKLPLSVRLRNNGGYKYGNKNDGNETSEHDKGLGGRLWSVMRTRPAIRASHAETTLAARPSRLIPSVLETV